MRVPPHRPRRDRAATPDARPQKQSDIKGKGQHVFVSVNFDEKVFGYGLAHPDAPASRALDPVAIQKWQEQVKGSREA
jgi:hypothetical protein